MKRCSRCGQEKPDTDFRVVSKEHGTLYSYCRPCQREHDTQYHAGVRNGTRKPRRTNLTEQVFGSLTVIRRVGHTKYGCNLWECQCTCGDLTTASAGELNSGHKASCGCQRYASKTLPPDECVFREVYRKYRESAQSRRIVFALTMEEFRAIILQDCHYCGHPPDKVRKMEPRFQRVYTYICNGVDRADNTQGYTVGNCVPCCEDCNRAKLQMSVQTFIQLCHRVSQRHQINSPSAVQTQ